MTSTLFHPYVYNSIHCSTFFDVCDSSCCFSTERNLNQTNMLNLQLRGIQPFADYKPIGLKCHTQGNDGVQVIQLSAS